MYVVVAGGGKVGSNSARTLLQMGHEVTMIEQRPDRFALLEEEFGPAVLRGDATEIYVLERAGIARPPELVLAVTGDDEDNLIIAQIAKEGYGVEKAIARVNDPRNQQHFKPAPARGGRSRDRRGRDRAELARRGVARGRCAAARGVAPDLRLPPRPHRARRREDRDPAR
jgi:hypothetical protein